MAIEGKIPASGPISFGAVRGFLAEGAPTHVCHIEPRILAAYEFYLNRIAEEGGAFYWQSQLECGDLTIEEIESRIAADGVLFGIVPGGTVLQVLDDSNYNMNRDMLRVITKSNANQPIKASDLRSKDNSIGNFDSPYLLDVQQRNVTPVSPPFFLNDYFSGDQYKNGDTLKVTVFSHYGEGYVAWSSFGRNVINFFINTKNYYDSGFVLNNGGGSKTHNSRVIYDPADNSIKIQGAYLGKASGNKNAHCSLLRVEYVPFPLTSCNFYQYYENGIDDYKANHD